MQFQVLLFFQTTDLLTHLFLVSINTWHQLRLAFVTFAAIEVTYDNFKIDQEYERICDIVTRKWCCVMTRVPVHSPYSLKSYEGSQLMRFDLKLQGRALSSLSHEFLVGETSL